MISLYIKNTTETFNISQVVESVTWSGDYKQCCRKLEFTVMATSSNKGIPGVNIKCGDMALFYEDGKELFRGFIYTCNKSSSSNSKDYVAYDHGVKLKDIKYPYVVKNKTANEICDKIITDFKFKKGSIEKVNTKVSKVYLGSNLYDVIMDMYTQASKVNGYKYMINFKEGKFSVIRKGTIKLKVAFEEGKNLTDSSFTETIEKMINRVIIVDEKGNAKSEVKNDNDIKQYGLFQDILKIEEGKNSTVEAKSMLKGIERTCSIDGYGDSSCITGYAVIVKDGNTGLEGLFYIDNDTHKWENGDYSINLGLNFKNIMDDVEVSDEASTESVTTKTTVSGGREVTAEFTAYYPANTTMQGGFYDAMGNRLDASKLTCAAPKDVAFNTKIQVKGTGTSRDNLVYKCTDRGGAIKVVNGVYHIDLLMATKSECYNFGRRRGKAIIGVTVSNGTSATNSKAKKAVELASTKVGNRYVWGATGPNNFDCSGLTSWCYKQVGISIPRTSSAQSSHGKSVSKDNLQTGDLVFFSTNGTGRVSHVGIYEGNGVFIHAASTKSGIKRSKLSESYYTKAWKGARRVV